jgi:hypothetical protein
MAQIVESEPATTRCFGQLAELYTETVRRSGSAVWVRENQVVVRAFRSTSHVLFRLVFHEQLEAFERSRLLRQTVVEHRLIYRWRIIWLNLDESQLSDDRHDVEADERSVALERLGRDARSHGVEPQHQEPLDCTRRSLVPQPPSPRGELSRMPSSANSQFTPERRSFLGFLWRGCTIGCLIAASGRRAVL